MTTEGEGIDFRQYRLYEGDEKSESERISLPASNFKPMKKKIAQTIIEFISDFLPIEQTDINFSMCYALSAIVGDYRK